MLLCQVIECAVLGVCWPTQCHAGNLFDISVLLNGARSWGACYSISYTWATAVIHTTYQWRTPCCCWWVYVSVYHCSLQHSICCWYLPCECDVELNTCLMTALLYCWMTEDTDIPKQLPPPTASDIGSITVLQCWYNHHATLLVLSFCNLCAGLHCFSQTWPPCLVLVLPLYWHDPPS